MPYIYIYIYIYIYTHTHTYIYVNWHQYSLAPVSNTFKTSLYISGEFSVQKNMLNKKHDMKLTSNIKILPLITLALNNATGISICTLLLTWNWSKQNFCVHSLDCSAKIGFSVRCITLLKGKCFKNCMEITSKKQRLLPCLHFSNIFQW